MATTPIQTHPKNLSIDCYRKLTRAQYVAQSLFLDLYQRPTNGQYQPHLPFLFSYLADVLSDISEELNTAGLFAAFQTTTGGAEHD